MTWTPPQGSDAAKVLDSAHDDVRSGLHAQSLAKFLWFHHNALKRNRGLGGVRLSFALSYWLELASVYSPAMAAFIRTRDETEAAFLANPSFELFHDLAALNDHLGEKARTVEMFVRTAQADHSLAKRLYRVAERSLVAVGCYEACRPFLDSTTRLKFAAELYTAENEMEQSGAFAAPPLARRLFISNVATLVALLSLNSRTAEARSACSQALTVLDDVEFREILDAAMSGHLPPAVSYP